MSILLSHSGMSHGSLHANDTHPALVRKKLHVPLDYTIPLLSRKPGIVQTKDPDFYRRLCTSELFLYSSLLPRSQMFMLLDNNILNHNWSRFLFDQTFPRHFIFDDFSAVILRPYYPAQEIIRDFIKKS